MTEEEYRQAEEGLDNVLRLFRKNDSDLRVAEIKIRASLEASRAELLKLAIKAREDTTPPFRVVQMDAEIVRVGNRCLRGILFVCRQPPARKPSS